jgi:hypothetical protein
MSLYLLSMGRGDGRADWIAFLGMSAIVLFVQDGRALVGHATSRTDDANQIRTAKLQIVSLADFVKITQMVAWHGKYSVG